MNEDPIRKYMVTGTHVNFGPECNYQRTQIIKAHTCGLAEERFKIQNGVPFGIDPMEIEIENVVDV